jgi:hypothetical protein
MNTPLMECGHAANATDGAGRPACVICAGINPGAVVVDDSPPSLEGRRAKCFYARGRDGREHALHGVPSSGGLAFFKSCPGELFDRYYCGCWGWD